MSEPSLGATLAQLHGQPQSSNGTVSDAARIVRLTWMVMYLVRYGRMSRRDYMERWEVSQRAFMRDLAVLRDAGIVVHFNRTRIGEDRHYRFYGFRSDMAA